MPRSTKQLHGKARIDKHIREMNAETRAKTECLHCGNRVSDEEYGWKYAGAGGVLAGPFCGRECQFGWLNDG